MADNVDDRTLYVSNLHKDVTEELLYELFLQAGPIEKVSIPNLNPKLSFKYGFVTYHHECSIDYALDLYKGTSLFKKEISIKRKGGSVSDRSRSGDSQSHSQRYNDVHNFDMNQRVSYKEQQQQNLPSLLDGLNSSKTSSNGHNLMQSSLKGQWSNHNRPYGKNSRSNYPSRSLSSRNNLRNSPYSNSDYKKSHRDRKGRY